MPSYYQLLISEDIRKDKKSIIDTLTSIMNGKLADDIHLLNLYREVPISFGASIVQIEEEMVEMTVHQLQAIAMKLQQETIIRSSHFKHDVVAKVARAEPDKNFVLLNQFSYVQMLADRRAHVRVNVSEHIEVTFRVNQHLLQGMLQDISVGGIAVMAQEQPEFNENMKGVVSMPLDGDMLQIPATLLRITDSNSEKVYAFMFNADSKIEKIISHFVFRIQSEVIRELRGAIV